MVVARWMVFPVAAVLLILPLSAQTDPVGQTTPVATQSFTTSWNGWYYPSATSPFLSALGAPARGSLIFHPKQSVKSDLRRPRLPAESPPDVRPSSPPDDPIHPDRPLPPDGPIVEAPPVTAIPEPLTMALVATGLVVLAGVSAVRRIQGRGQSGPV